MLVIMLRNISGLREISDYEYNVYVNTRKIATGIVEGHNRGSGWQNLVQMLSEQAAEEGSEAQ